MEHIKLSNTLYNNNNNKMSSDEDKCMAQQQRWQQELQQCHQKLKQEEEFLEEKIVFKPCNRIRGATLTQVSSGTVTSQPTQSDLLKEPLQKREHGEPVGLCITPISRDCRRPGFKDYREQMNRVAAGHTLMWDAPLRNRTQPSIGDYFIFWFHKEGIIVHRITDIRLPTSRLETWTTPGDTDRDVLFLSPECCKMDWATFQEANGYKRCMGTVCARPCRLSTILPAIEHAISEVPVA